MELFLVDDCEDIPLGAVLGVVKVDYRPPPGDWADRGGEEQEGEMEEEDGRHFFYQKWCVILYSPLPYSCPYSILGMILSWHGSRTHHVMSHNPAAVATPPITVRAVSATRSKRR